MPPPSFDDEQLTIIRHLAKPIDRRLRGQFLKVLTSELQRYFVVSPGDISRVGAEMQRRFLNGEAVRAQADSRFKPRVDSAHDYRSRIDRNPRGVACRRGRANADLRLQPPKHRDRGAVQ